MSPLCNERRRDLLRLARQSIRDAVTGQFIPDVPDDFSLQNLPGGVFVTLHADGRLRGCVGQTQGAGSLGELVVRAAIGAALHDSRFSPVTLDEMEILEIEISILSEFVAVEPDSIVVGMHGLLVVQGKHRGLLLPQVAALRRWPPRRFLEETCVKAGLGCDGWKNPSTIVHGFTAEVFSDAPVPANDGDGRPISGAISVPAGKRP